jgi:predicted amidophosphoribosyltransferase
MAYSRKLELDTIRKMLLIHCRDMHEGDKYELCPECKKMLDYAERRMDKCFYGDDKPVCSQCPVHCYKPEMREKIKKVMRYSGPRMLRHSPILSIRYIFRKRFKSPRGTRGQV